MDDSSIFYYESFKEYRFWQNLTQGYYDIDRLQKSIIKDMKKSITAIAILIVFIGYQESFANENTFFDSVKFIQYLDESTALEEVRNENLDIYYYRISSDRIENNESRQGLQIFDSTSGSYSILVNPADSKEYNPFSDRDIRFALNYLIDRKLIVNELMNGYGSPIISYYSPSSPEYLTVIEQLESFDFKYNPTLAEKIISESLRENGAIKNEGVWEIDSKPIEITIFIRSDDSIRKSMGEILSVELEKIGFIVKKEFGDLNKACTIVYGSNPAELKWSLYTEAWTTTAFVKYNPTALSQMYAPWFSSMPGFNDSTYWNYENEKIDTITQKIYSANFTSSEERAVLIQDAIVEGINESVRIFVASKIDQFVANEKISGIINDFGAGVPSRFTPINAKSTTNDNEELTIGVKQIYQGAWNPVMGFTDSYSRYIWGIVSDPGTFKHPFTGETIPVRTTWIVETDPDGKIIVPTDAKKWNPSSQSWENIPPNTLATSKVTFDFKFSNWHNGQPMDINDILYSLYLTIEWGTQTDGNDLTFDAEFTPRTAQEIQNMVGINQIDEDTIEVYINYWHFDEREIAQYAELWSSMPWEILASMEKAVTDGKVSFSRSSAVNKNVSWLSLIIPNDADIIKENLQNFRDAKHVPSALQENEQSFQYYQDRYKSSIKWIEDNNHAVISNGPFYLESYTPESRTIKVKEFKDKSYPFKAGKWAEFETTRLPTIKDIKMKSVIEKGENISISTEVENTDSIIYFLTNGKGELVSSQKIDVSNKENIIKIQSKDLEKLNIGGNNIKIFAISNSVLRPDLFESSFILTGDKNMIPNNTIKNIEDNGSEMNYESTVLLLIVLTVITGIIVYFIKKITTKNNLSK